ncbi:MAG: O-antigen ligase family protein [Chloroflexota bacterium]
MFHYDVISPVKVIPTSRLAVRPLGAPEYLGALGLLTTLGLLSAPLPTAWLGAAGLVGLIVASLRSAGDVRQGLIWLFPTALFLAGAVLGLQVTVQPDAAGIRFTGMLAAIASFLAVSQAAQTVTAARRISIGLLVVALIGTPVVFILVAPFIGLERFPQAFTDWLRVFEPLRQAVLDQDDVLQRYRLRASGLGTLAAFGIALSLGPLLAGQSLRSRLLGAGCIGYFALFLTLAANRGAILTATLVTVSVVLISSPWLRSRALVLGATAVAAFGLFTWVNQHVQLRGLARLLAAPTVDFGSVFRRAEFWDNSIFLIGDFRFTGVGLGLRSVQEMYETYFLPVDPRFSHAHNIFLQTYLEQGVLGFTGLIGLVVTGAFALYRVHSVSQDSQGRWVAFAATAATMTLLIAGLTEVVALTSVGMVMFASALGLVAVLARSRQAAQRDPRVVARVVAAGRVIVAVGLALAVVVPVIYAQGESQAREARPSAASWLQSVMGSVYLNAGNVELMKVSVGIKRSREERDERLTRGEDYLNRALELDSSNPAAMRSLAALHTIQSQRSAARRMLSQAEALADPNDQSMAFQIGRLYRDMGEVDRAVDAWTRAGAAPQIVQWGNALVRRAQWRQALQVNRAGIRVAPNERSPWQGVAISVDQISGRRAAIITMERLGALYPNNPWPYLAGGDLYANDADHETARAWYGRGLILAPGEPVLVARLEGRTADDLSQRE